MHLECEWNAKLRRFKHGRNGLLTVIEQPSTHEHGNKYDGQPADATDVRIPDYLLAKQFVIEWTGIQVVTF